MDLNPFDDYPFHQAIAPIDRPFTSDKHFNDGYWFAFYRTGQYVFCGMRIHPNSNVIDGYGGMVHEGEQRNVRFSRALRPRTNDLSVGPFRLEILEPMQVQRIVLGPNESGVEFDATIRARAPMTLEEHHFQIRHGAVIADLLRYSGIVKAEGSLTIDGERIDVDDSWYGARDHSWGIRSTMGIYTPTRGIEEQGVDPRAIRIWIPFDLGEVRGFFHTHEDADGNTLDFQGEIWLGERRVDLLAVRHSFRYEEGSRRLESGEFTLVDAEGNDHAFTFRVVCEPAHPQGFGYNRGWSDGGGPGVYRGAEVVETSRFDVTDPNVAAGGAHLPADRQLGGTEFACSATGPNGTTGMVHVEHMIYGTYRPSGLEGPNQWK
jgi:hypothetical protein